MSKPPPPPPQASRFEPLPLGANAFAPPVFHHTQGSDEEPSRLRKALPWLVVVGIAAASALGVWVALLVSQPSKPESKAEPKVAAAEKAAEAEAEPAVEEKAPAEPAPVVASPELPPAQPQAAAEAPAAEAKDQEAADEKADGRTEAERDAAREKRKAAREAKAAAATVKLPATPSRDDVIATMKRVNPAIVRCMNGAHAVVTADMKVLNTGKVASVNVSGAPGSAGSCIAGAVRKARFPEFTNASIAVRYPMKL